MHQPGRTFFGPGTGHGPALRPASAASRNGPAFKKVGRTDRTKLRDRGRRSDGIGAATRLRQRPDPKHAYLRIHGPAGLQEGGRKPGARPRDRRSGGIGASTKPSGVTAPARRLAARARPDSKYSARTGPARKKPPAESPLAGPGAPHPLQGGAKTLRERARTTAESK